MRLVIGRGASRRVYEFPCAAIIRKAPKDAGSAFLKGVRELVGVTA